MNALNAYGYVGGSDRLNSSGNDVPLPIAMPSGMPAIAESDDHGYPTLPSAWTPPRALVFEIENVLYDATLWQRWLWRLLGRFAAQRDYQGFCDVWQRGYLPEVHRGGREWSDAFRAFLVDCGLSPGQIDEVEGASMAQRRDLTEHLRPMPGAAKTLAELSSSGVMLGVLANSDLAADALHFRIDRLGMKACFRFVLSSRDLGCAKPEPACYQAALDCLSLPVADVAFVGCASDDLTGAAAIGLRTIAANRDSSAVAADICVPNLESLTTLCAPAAANSSIVERAAICR